MNTQVGIMVLHLDDVVNVELTDAGAALYDSDEFREKARIITGAPAPSHMDEWLPRFPAKVNKTEEEKLHIKCSLRAFIALFGPYFFDFDKREHYADHLFVDGVITIRNWTVNIPDELSEEDEKCGG